MDIEKMFAAACKALQIPEDSSPDQLKAAIDAAAGAKMAQEKLAEIQSGKKAAPAEEEPKEEEKAEEAAASGSAEPPLLSSVPKLSVEPPVVPASPPGVVEATETKTEETVKELADSPEAEAAAAKQVFDKLAAATGLDAAALVAFVSDNSEAIGALAGKQPDSGQPSDKPGAPAAPAVGASAVVAELESTKAILSKTVTDLEKERTVRLAREAAEKKSAAEAKADALIKSGKAFDTARPHLVTLAHDSPEAFDNLVKLLPEVVPQGEHAKTVGPDESVSVELTGNQMYAFKTFRAAGIEEKKARELASKSAS